jgi:hypothetical protein
VKRCAITLFCSYLVALVVAVGSARAGSPITRHDRNVIRFFQHHPRLAATPAGARVLLRVLPHVVRALASVTPPQPQWWLNQAACIRSHEGTWNDATGNGYYGAYQFLLSTWQSVGGQGYPSNASPTEQTYRAWLVWQRDGGSWREWSTASICGVG